MPMVLLGPPATRVAGRRDASARDADVALDENREAGFRRRKYAEALARGSQCGRWGADGPKGGRRWESGVRRVREAALRRVNRLVDKRETTCAELLPEERRPAVRIAFVITRGDG